MRSLLLWLLTLTAPAAALQAGADPAAELRARLAETVVEHGESAAPARALRGELAALLEAAGRFAEALPLRAANAEACRAELGAAEETLFAWNALGNDQFYVGRYRDAVASWERALELAEQLDGPESDRAATAWVNLSAARLALGDAAGAAEAAGRGVGLHAAVHGEEHASVADALRKLAQAQVALGELEAARESAEEAFLITRAVTGEDSLATADAAEILAYVLARAGAVEEAFALNELCLSVRAEQLGDAHPFTVRARNNLAARLVNAGRYEEAAPLVEAVYEQQRAAAGPDHPDTITAGENLGWIRAQLGRGAEAVPLLERALAAHEAARGPRHPATVRCRSSLCTALSLAGEGGRALELFPDAYETALEVHGESDPTTTDVALDWSATAYELGELELAWEVIGLARRGQTAWNRRISRSASSWELLSGAGLRYLRVARELALARRMGAPAVERQAYASVLAWKSAASRALTAARGEGLSERAAELARELQGARSALAEAVLAGEAREDELTALRERRGRLERELRASTGATPRVAAGPSEVALALPDDAVAVDLLLNQDYLPDEEGGAFGARWAGERLTAWVTRPGEAPRRIELGPSAPMRDAAERFVASIAAGAPNLRGLGRRAEAASDEGADRELYELIWAPLVDAIGDARTVVLSPDDFLAALPFHALRDADGQYLLERHAIVLLHDLASLPEVVGEREAPSTPVSALLVGAVDYDVRAGDDARPEAGEWLALTATGAELDALTELARSSDVHVDELRHSAATEERLVAALPGHRVVHLATHGFYRAAEDDRGHDLHRMRVSGDTGLAASESERAAALLPGAATGLVCAGANLGRAPGRADGLLTAEETSGLDLSACDLVVLSACETALGTARGGEAMASLQRAFRLAGARAVIASMWSVDDVATAELMAELYANLWERGLPAAEALRQAQLTLLARNRETRNADLPWTWAAFALSGDWR